MKQFIATILLLTICGMAYCNDHWYLFTTDSPKEDGRRLYGSSPYSPEELKDKLNSPGFIKISNLIYFDNQQRPKPWSAWDPLFKNEIYVRTQSIIDFQELTENPLNSKK